MAKIFFSPDDDAEMQHAFERARETFRYCWRELSWEQRRIIPGLDVAAVKVGFADPDTDAAVDEVVSEQMWLNELEFDGQEITGTLLNEPQWLKSVEAGDRRSVRPGEISDWMYAVRRHVYGGYTIQLLRSRMGAAERVQHDRAWGMKFGAPDVLHVVPPEWFGKEPTGGFLKRLFGGGRPEPVSAAELETTEHPMALSMAEAFADMIEEDRSALEARDQNGLTILHQMALAGSATIVSVLLEQGADPTATTTAGHTPLALAEALGWSRVIEQLQATSTN